MATGELWTTAADLVFPRDCVACGAPLRIGDRRALCPACWTTLRPPSEPRCHRCDAPTPPLRPTCLACLTDPPAFDRVRTLGLYLAHERQASPLALAVRALKYHGERGVAACLGRALAERHPPPGDAVVVPVPLHPRRLRERGYNQALVLARALARAAGLAVRARELRRIRPTPSQAGLDARARRANLDGAFRVGPHARIAGRAVVLVDDVLTTGATADACAATLRRAGATTVVVYAVGRTP
jgi:ComF family protein